MLLSEKSYTSRLPKYQELIKTLPSNLDNGLVEKVLETCKGWINQERLNGKIQFVATYSEEAYS